MKELKLPQNLAGELQELYALLAVDYDAVAERIGLACTGCPDNCCDSYFLHFTYTEWAYLWQVLQELESQALLAVEKKAKDYVLASQHALTQGKRPQLMCPLNEKGLCQLYNHRLMICRAHGVPASLTMPNGQKQTFPGCFRCQEMVELQSRSEGEVPLADRTAALRRLVQVEQSLLGIGLKRYPKIRFAIAEMITHGPPQALD